MLLFIAFCVLMPVPADSAPANHQYSVYSLTAARQQSPSEEVCGAGFRVSEVRGTRKCISCTRGVNFSNHSNAPFCLLCSVCKPDEDEISPCTLTRDTECQCKAGTFLERDAPEICQKCSTGCPDGKVQYSPCTPWSDLKCVPREEGFGIWIGITVVVFLLLAVLAVILSCIPQGCGMASKYVNRVLFWWLCSQEGPGTHDNAQNEALSNRLDPELGEEGQEQTEVTGDRGQTPVEAEALQVCQNAEESQRGWKPLVPVNGTDPTETLRSFFDYFIKEVPFASWKAVMRQMGLRDNEMEMARASETDIKEQCYKMLVQWLQKTGKDASVNTLLDALEAQEQRNARERIQKSLVLSGKYTYKEDRPDTQ
ncbi:tumor necrosis factor receptor superfamily member 10A-like isoform X2 [Loxodonta africana]|uniref:tumor necrosis factor receptor superfamily member 10A-like isoform X2 n=1 Tax=Loxodonta africana TaxID=9785 RepID=UPI0030D426CF